LTSLFMKGQGCLPFFFFIPTYVHPCTKEADDLRILLRSLKCSFSTLLWIHLATDVRFHHPDDGGSTHPWNVDLLRDYTALYPRRLSSSYYFLMFCTLSIVCFLKS
jgi:hypothetical protein